MTISLPANTCVCISDSPDSAGRATYRGRVGTRRRAATTLVRRHAASTGAACLGALLFLGSLAVAPPVDARPPAQPSISGGSSALGSSAVVALAMFDGSRWRVCSAALLRPRVLLTAAHCLVRPGTTEPMTRVRVFPPGARARVFATSGPRRPSPVRVQRWWLAADLPRGTTVQPDDVAAILLTADLAPRAFTRIATSPELARWREGRQPVVHVGYGGAGAGRYSTVPQWIQLPLRTLGVTTLGSTFSTTSSTQQALCAGDSGGPAYVLDGTSAYLVGTMAGATGGCSPDGATPTSNLGFTTLGYLPIVNAALVEAGHPAIPSAPRGLRQIARNRDVTVQWSAPAAGAEAVVSYDVVDAAGTLVCQTTGTSCVRQGLPDGSYGHVVRARNAEDEGDDSGQAAVALVAAPPQPAAPTVERLGRSRYRVTIGTLAGRTSAVVTSYTVRTQTGQIACSVPAPPPDAPSLSCQWAPRKGTYTLTVQADTQMGPSPVSVPSARVSVR